MSGEEQIKADSERAPRSVIGPLVFVSHDSRDADLAEAFSKLLSSVSAGMLKSFRSSDHKGVQGIDFGVEWYPELMRKLDAACDIVCLLTARSLGRPWILYEAGVAKGKLDIPVHGLALGVPLARVSTGPFAQFQNCDDNVDSLAKLVEQLVRRLPHADPDHDTVMGQVEAFKTKVDDILAAQEAAGGEPEVQTEDPSSAKLFEEIKVMFQDLPSRIETVTQHGDRRRILRRGFHPKMLDEALMMTSRGEQTLGVAALIITSFFREELPWLYTMAVEVYRASLGEDPSVLRRAHGALVRAVESLEGGPMFFEMPESRSEARELRMLLHELPRMLAHFAALDFEGSQEAEAAPADRRPEPTNR